MCVCVSINVKVETLKKRIHIELLYEHQLLNSDILTWNRFSSCTYTYFKSSQMISGYFLSRFGFVPCNVVTPDKTHSPPPAMSSSHLHPMESGDYAHQYVHCTVGMFVLIPELKSSSNPPSSTCSSSSSPHLGKKSSSDMHKDYIARQQSNLRSEHNYRMGFLWSWNFMSSRRWRSQHTGDEQFQDRMLADFREFCQCKDGRLLDFLKDFGFST